MTLQDCFFWFFAGESWRARLRLLHIWLSPRITGYRDRPPVAVGTRFLNGRPIYMRSGSTDVRVLRHIFGHCVYSLPDELTGKVSSVVDLGANTGISMLYFAERYPSAHIVAVEPDSSSYACLLENARNIPGEDRVTTVRACVSDRKGTARFSTGGQSWGRAIVQGDGEGVEVPSLTIADLMEDQGLERVDILKMDIEGGERLAFKTVDQWLDRVGWVLMEVHFAAISISELVDTVAARGRRIFRKDSGPPSEWVQLGPEFHSQIKKRVPSLDVVIPPVGVSP